jgi:DeoR/GlpR family transcriptional regulator of sugar metabolism
VDKLFFSCAGVELERGLSDLSVEQANIRRLMIKQADQRIFLVDHSKFGVKALSVISGFDIIDEVITNQRTPREALEKLREMDVKVTVADAEPVGQKGSKDE